MMNDCFSVAEENGTAVCGIICSDSVRKIDEDKNNSMLDRNKVILIQTPQCFRLSLIKQAYNQPFNPVFTDDASYVEDLNERINIIKGRKENIKITLPIDLEIAKVIKEQEDDK
jgi:2-C-methyl-D-erythritol 4-phosphate cytidylyltransferase